MIIVDNALRERARVGRPVRVGLIGAGYSGRRITYQILTAVPGMTVIGIGNRTVAHAREAFAYAGVNDAVEVHDAGGLDAAVSSGRSAVSSDFRALTESEHVDVIVEATGTIEYGAHVIKSAIEHGKHVVLMNVELDATVGPLLKAWADERGVVYSNSDGDEPGVAMNMLRFVRSIGLQPVVAGNLKGLYDPYRNPDTQVGFAATWGQKPQTMAHFADGTKLSMELNVLANAAGFRVARRGMYGPKLAHVNESAGYFGDKLGQ
jgi:predicted homoserine dehydrogenase-like protein